MVREPRTSLDRVIEQHRQLREFADDVSKFVEERGPDPGVAAMHDWAETLGKKLERLHGLLSRHFREEEESGMFEELCMRHPHHCKDLDDLRNEHTTILRELRAVHDAAVALVTKRTAPARDLAEWAGAVIARFERHEQDENGFIQKLFGEELGTGD